jgi:flavin-dependent dehydrogenase
VRAIDDDSSLESRDSWDVIVLGAGPAGAVAAHELAQRSLRVLLVEKHRLPRFKVCGGCLGGGALAILDRIGLSDLPDRCDGVLLEKMRLSSGARAAEIPIGRRVAVSREKFDHVLVGEAEKAGVIVQDQTVGTLLPPNEEDSRRVRLRCGSEEGIVRASVVLVATGLSCPPSGYTVATAPDSLVGLSAIIEGGFESLDRNTLYMTCGNEGYVGIAAISRGCWDVAAAVSPKALAGVSSAAELVRGMIEQGGVQANASLEAAAWRGTPALTRCARPLAGRRCLLIGDAAGYVEPFTGEGIGWAMQSALEASSLAVQQIDAWNEDVVERWSREYEGALAARQRRCRTVAWALRSAALRAISVQALAHLPKLARPIVRRLDQALSTQRIERPEIMHAH